MARPPRSRLAPAPVPQPVSGSRSSSPTTTRPGSPSRPHRGSSPLHSSRPRTPPRWSSGRRDCCGGGCRIVCALPKPLEGPERMTYLQAIVIGLLQGVTELFPISSLGHSVLLPGWLGWDSLVHGQSADESFYLAFLVGVHV